MKILHLGKFNHPNLGGMENVMFGLMADDRDCQHHAVCFSRGMNDASAFNIQSYKCLEIFGQPISLRYVYAALMQARLADIVHVHLPNYLALLISLVYPEKSVLHWHSDVLSKGILSRLLRPLELLAVFKAKHIVFTSQEYKDSSYAASAFRNNRRVSIIPLSLNEDNTQPVHIGLREKYLLFVGRLVAYKNTGFLIELSKYLPETWSIKIIGDGPEAHRFAARASEKCDTRKIEYLGRLDETNKIELMRHASFVILPSNNRAEAFGVVLLEALRVGTPIICPMVHGSGMNGVNSDEKVGFRFDDFDAKKWAEQIIDTNYLERFDEKYIQSYFMRNYSDEVVISQWREIYDKFRQDRGLAP